MITIIFLTITLAYLLLFGFDIEAVGWLAFNCYFPKDDNLLIAYTKRCDDCLVRVTDLVDESKLDVIDETGTDCGTIVDISGHPLLSQSFRIDYFSKELDIFIPAYEEIILPPDDLKRQFFLSCNDIEQWLLDEYGTGTGWFPEPFALAEGDLIKIIIINAFNVPDPIPTCINGDTEEILGWCWVREIPITCPPPQAKKPVDCTKEDFRNVDQVNCPFILCTVADKLPRYGQYGDTYPRDCQETLYYHENEHGLPSWTPKKEGAKEFPLDKKDAILDIFNSKFPQFCKKIYTAEPCVPVDPCVKPQPEPEPEPEPTCSDIVVENPNFESENWDIGNGGPWGLIGQVPIATGSNPAKVSTTIIGTPSSSIIALQNFITVYAGTYRIYYDLEPIDSNFVKNGTWIGSASVGEVSATIFTITAESQQSGFVDIVVPADVENSTVSAGVTFISDSPVASNFSLIFREIRIECLTP